MADHKEYWSAPGEQGTIRISEDVAASIAAIATEETEGVSGLYSSITSDIVNFVSKKNPSKGVRVTLLDNDEVSLEISFLVVFGCSVLDVAKAVQEHVKSAVESMTGLTVIEINVHVGGVTFAAAATEAEATAAEQAAVSAEPVPQPEKEDPAEEQSTAE